MEDKLERELLYYSNEYSIGVDGALDNPSEKPLTNIIYELALQLKRKKDECEQYKRKAEKADKICTETTEFLRQRTLQFQDEKANFHKQLQAEQQKVKELEEKLELAKKDMCQKCDFQKTYFDNTKKLMKEKQNYKQALEEISKLLNLKNVNNCWYLITKCDECSGEEECGMGDPVEKLRQILQKCDVLDE